MAGCAPLSHRRSLFRCAVLVLLSSAAGSVSGTVSGTLAGQAGRAGLAGGGAAASALRSSSAFAASALGKKVAPRGLAFKPSEELPREAITMKTWAMMKESIDKIGDEVGQIGLVRKDISMLQEDLLAQEHMWHQADVQLEAEAEELHSQIANLQREVHIGKAVDEEVLDLKRDIEELKRQKVDLEQHAAQYNKQVRAEEKQLRAHLAKALETLKTENKTADEEVQEIQQARLADEGEVAKLQLKANELEGRLRAGERHAANLADNAAAKTAELKHQLTSLEQETKHLESQLLSKEQMRKELASMRQQLNQEKTEIVNVQDTKASVTSRCAHEEQGRQEVLRAERAKAITRRKEMVVYCNTVHNQHASLQQFLVSAGC